ncbi:MAG: RnfABCDGE type electron transport complex subunit D, partial [Clostridia bacterium]|nr:RnfABCDGE type electron transport complex subunit D [Clostridia bacterium]
LVPALICSVMYFGVRSLYLTALCMIFCVGFEYLWQKITKKPVTISDGTAAVTGMLLAFNLPVTVPWWLCLIGSFVAIIIAKQFFGGVGHNFINPALAGRAFLMASWPILMTRWVEPFSSGFFIPEDLVSSATPLAILKTPDVGVMPDLQHLFLGNIGGCIGETSALALLIGGVYLVARKIISCRIPVTYVATVAVLAFLFPNAGFTNLNCMMIHVCSGSLLLGAIFMATDYVTSPITKKGQIIMGLGCGILTFVIRRFGGYPEGASYSIMLMNVATPLIDRWTQPKAYGTVKKEGGNK